MSEGEITDPSVDANEQSQTQETPERSFSQDDVNRYVARERKRLEEELKARPTAEQLQELQSRLAQMEEEKELAGKSEADRIEHKYQRELEKQRQSYEKLLNDMKEKDALAVAARQELDDYKVRTSFGEALNKAGVYGPAADDALDALLKRIENRDGFVESGRADYGDLLDETPESIAKRFLEERPHFASAKVGGAGTKPPNNAVARNRTVADMTMEELAEAAGDFPNG
jgi:hypothetical protein